MIKTRGEESGGGTAIGGRIGLYEESTIFVRDS